MLKRNKFGKKIRRFRKPNIAVLSLATLTVLLLLAWGGLYWQERSLGTADAKGNDGADLPVIMLDLDAPSDQPPVDQAADEGNKPGGEEGGDGEGSLLDDLKNSPGGLLGLEDGWPNLPDSPRGGEDGDKSENEPPTGEKPADSDDDEDAGQVIGGDPTEKPTKSPVPTPTPKPTVNPTPTSGLDPVVTDKPVKTPTPTDKPTESPTQNPTEPVETQAPDDPNAELEQQYELELVSLQASCIMDVKAVLKEAERKVGETEPSDMGALQRIGAEADASLEAAGAVCEGQFNEVAGRAAKDGVEAGKITEWRRTYDDVMEQLRAEAELKLQQLLGM